MINRKYLIRALCVGAFLGLMVPVLGGLIFPSMLVNVGGKCVVSGSDTIVLNKSDYSYKPGQSGTQYNFYRVSPDGKREEVTLQLIFYSILIYSAAFIVISLIISFLYQKVKYRE